MLINHLKFVKGLLSSLLQAERKRFDYSIDRNRNFEEVKTRSKEIRQLEKQINWYDEKIRELSNVKNGQN